MALVSRMVSDITGTEANEGEFIQLVVRQHPKLDEPKVLDALPAEVEGLSNAQDVVLLEVKNNGDSRQIAMTLADFRKVVKDDVLKHARSTRGRRPGYSPKANSAAKSE